MCIGKKDEWNDFADLLANLIEKYAAALDIDNLPEPPGCLENETTKNINTHGHAVGIIEQPKKVR